MPSAETPSYQVPALGKHIPLESDSCLEDVKNECHGEQVYQAATSHPNNVLPPGSDVLLNISCRAATMGQEHAFISKMIGYYGVDAGGGWTFGPIQPGSYAFT